MYSKTPLMFKKPLRLELSMGKMTYHNGVTIHQDGAFYAYCPVCAGIGLDEHNQPCSYCKGQGEGFEMSKHPDAFPVDVIQNPNEEDEYDEDDSGGS